MKYGQQFERDSVPQWSLYNLDYNSLKHEIKMHTTHHHATAMAIPGCEDPALVKFENALFAELCRQHDRVHLFVSSKADEILRRMEHLDSAINRRIQKYSSHPKSAKLILRRQRRFAKYDCDLLSCGNDIAALDRFSKAQVTAFRKILKKYKKWTGSTALHARFNDQVLGNFKSFTRRDFAPLRQRHREIVSNLRHAATALHDPTVGSPSSSFSLELPPSPVSSSSNSNRNNTTNINTNSGHDPNHSSNTNHDRNNDSNSNHDPDHDSNRNSNLDRHSDTTTIRVPRVVNFEPHSPAAAPVTAPPLTKYWNEYDDGSEAGDDFAGVTIAAADDDDDDDDDEEEGEDGVYAIYIDPRDVKSTFPGAGYLNALATALLPLETIRGWFRRSKDRPEERRWLLAGNGGRRQGQRPSYGGDAGGYLSTTTCTDSEEDHAGDYSSSDGIPTAGLYAATNTTNTNTHANVMPGSMSIGEQKQKLRRYRERMLRLGTAAVFVAAYVFMGVAGLLLATGRRRLRVQVDVGVALNVVLSLFCACAGLGMTLYRRDGEMALASRLVVWLLFTLACLVNGMLLILVVGNAP